MKVSINLNQIAGTYSTNTNYRVAIDEGFVLDSISKIPNAANATLGSITSFSTQPIIALSYQIYPDISDTNRNPIKAMTVTNRSLVFEPQTAKTISLYDITTATAVLKASIPTTSNLVTYVNNNMNIDLYDYVYGSKTYRLDFPAGSVGDLMKFDSVTTSSNFTTGAYISLPPEKKLSPPANQIGNFNYGTGRNQISNNYYAISTGLTTFIGTYTGSTYRHAGKIEIFNKSDDSHVRTISNTTTTPVFYTDGSLVVNTLATCASISDTYVALSYDNPVQTQIFSISTGQLIRTLSYNGLSFISGNVICISTGTNSNVYNITTGALLYTVSGSVIAISDSYILTSVSNTAVLYNISNGSVKYTFTPSLGSASAPGGAGATDLRHRITDTHTVITTTRYDTQYRYQLYVYSNTTGSLLYTFVCENNAVGLDDTYFMLYSSYRAPEEPTGRIHGRINVYSLATGNVVHYIDNPTIRPGAYTYYAHFGQNLVYNNKKLIASADYIGSGPVYDNLHSFNLNRLKT